MYQLFSRADKTTASVVAGSLFVGALVLSAVYLSGAYFGTSQNQLPKTAADEPVQASQAKFAKVAQPSSHKLGDPRDSANNVVSGQSASGNSNLPASVEVSSSKDALVRHVAQLQQTLLAQQATIASLQAAAAKSTAADPDINAAASERSEDEEDHEPLGRRDPTTIYPRAEIDTAIAEVESLLESAIAQGGYTTFDEQRYKELNKYLPSDVADAYLSRLMTAINEGVVVKYD